MIPPSSFKAAGAPGCCGYSDCSLKTSHLFCSLNLILSCWKVTQKPPKEKNHIKKRGIKSNYKPETRLATWRLIFQIWKELAKIKTKKMEEPTRREKKKGKWGYIQGSGQINAKSHTDILNNLCLCRGGEKTNPKGFHSRIPISL